jgi:hypothetical protein
MQYKLLGNYVPLKKSANLSTTFKSDVKLPWSLEITNPKNKLCFPSENSHPTEHFVK